MDNQYADLLKMTLNIDGVWLPEAASVTADSVDKPFWLIYWTCVVEHPRIGDVALEKQQALEDVHGNLP